MKNIKYVGMADHREISAEDFEKLEVKVGKEEANGLSFASGEIKALTDPVAKALMEELTFVTEFQELSDEDLKAEAEAVKAEEAVRAEALRAQLTGTTGTADVITQQSPAPSATGSTAGGTAGNGSSTAGAVT